MLKNLYAIKCPPIDRSHVLERFPPYWLWNPGTLSFKSSSGDRENYSTSNWLDCLNYDNGIYIVEGILNPVSKEDKYKLITAYDHLKNHPQKTLILLDSHIDLPDDLHPLIPVKEVPLPQGKTLRKQLQKYGKDPWVYETATLGLSIGELDTIIKKAKSPDDVIAYKGKKLKGRGLSLASQPDVPDIAGLDLLKKDLQTIAALFDPTAKVLGLRPPKGMMLWGLPGSGKSLTAKLAASLTGALLVVCDWNQLLADSEAESLDNLNYVLNLVDMLGPTILAIDEFEKAIAGSLNGGTTTKMVGKLLNWLQDHTSPVILLVTINHLSLLPPEMFRRFEYIWFFDNNLSNEAIAEIFNLHLRTRFSGWQPAIFTEVEWEQIFLSYASYTPAEIGKAIALAQTQLYLMAKDEKSTDIIDFVNNYPIKHPTRFYQLILRVQEEVKASITIPFLSKQLEQILMYSGYARPVSSPGTNTSLFTGTKYETDFFSLQH